MTFATYLIVALVCFGAACMTPNEGRAFGLALLAVLTLIAAAVHGDLLK